MLFAPEKDAAAGEGMTETQFKATGLGKEMVDEAMLPLNRGLAKLTHNGGKGQEGLVLTDGTVLTAKETKAKAIAIQVKSDVEAHFKGRKFQDIPMIELAPFAGKRVKTDDPDCSDAQILRELMSMQNTLKYGS